MISASSLKGDTRNEKSNMIGVPRYFYFKLRDIAIRSFQPEDLDDLALMSAFLASAGRNVPKLSFEAMVSY